MTLLFHVPTRSLYLVPADCPYPANECRPPTVEDLPASLLFVGKTVIGVTCKPGARGTEIELMAGNRSATVLVPDETLRAALMFATAFDGVVIEPEKIEALIQRYWQHGDKDKNSMDGRNGQSRLSTERRRQ